MIHNAYLEATTAREMHVPLQPSPVNAARHIQEHSHIFNVFKSVLQVTAFDIEPKSQDHQHQYCLPLLLPLTGESQILDVGRSPGE